MNTQVLFAILLWALTFSAFAEESFAPSSVLQAIHSGERFPAQQALERIEQESHPDHSPLLSSPPHLEKIGWLIILANEFRSRFDPVSFSSLLSRALFALQSRRVPSDSARGISYLAQDGSIADTETHCVIYIALKSYQGTQQEQIHAYAERIRAHIEHTLNTGSARELAIGFIALGDLDYANQLLPLWKEQTSLLSSEDQDLIQYALMSAGFPGRWEASALNPSAWFGLKNKSK